MPTWKRKTNDEVLFHHLCAECDQRMTAGLLKADWVKIRDNDTVVCGECSRKCGLTARALWGAEDPNPNNHNHEAGKKLRRRRCCG